MNAKIVFSIIGLGMFLLGAAAASEEPLRFQQLRTLQNDTFNHVEVIKADATGAYIRHSRGLARIRFMDLPHDIRPKLEAGAVPFNPVKEALPEEQVAPKNHAQSHQWIVVQRPNPVPAYSTRGCANLLTNTPGVLPYPHSLVLYPCRKLAELDFLYVTGILQRPPGVKIHRLWETRFN